MSNLGAGLQKQTWGKLICGRLLRSMADSYV
jgi:hypothetical protein